MPTEARWFAKAGLCYLLLTFVVGGTLLAREAAGRPLNAVWNVEHAHLGTVGWLVNTVIGIALWMLPLNRSRFPSTQGRYPPRMVAACFICLNGGLLLRLAAEPWYQLGGQTPGAATLLYISAVAQPVGIAILVIVVWQRVRPPATKRPAD